MSGRTPTPEAAAAAVAQLRSFEFHRWADVVEGLAEKVRNQRRSLRALNRSQKRGRERLERKCEHLGAQGIVIRELRAEVERLREHAGGADVADAAGLAAELSAQRVAFRFDERGEHWPPSAPHSDHHYDARCAICRAGDYPEALEAVLATALRSLRDGEQL